MNQLFVVDGNGRYAYNKQPSVCRWNLRKLSEALAIGGLTEEMAKEGLQMYVRHRVNHVHMTVSCRSERGSVCEYVCACVLAEGPH